MPEIFGPDRSFTADLTSRGTGTVKVDGHDISGAVRAFDFSAGVGHMPRVTLDLGVYDATRMESKRTEVVMGSATRDLLIDAGWQPPADPDERPLIDEGEGLLT